MTTRDSVFNDQPIADNIASITTTPYWSKYSSHRSTRKYTIMPLASGIKKGGYSVSNEQEYRTSNNKPAEGTGNLS